MRLFEKISVTLIISMATSAAVAITAVALIFLPQYEQMDRSAALATAARVEGALLREVQGIQSSTADWGNWDDTRDFSLNFNNSYIAKNVTFQSLTTINTDELLIADMEGRVLYQFRIPTEDGLAQKSFVPSKLMPQRHWPSKAQLTPKQYIGGLLETPQGPAIVAMTRITNSEYSNPVDRILVLITLIDEDVIRGVEEQSGSRFTLTKRENTLTDPDVPAMVDAKAATPLLKKTQSGYDASISILGTSGRVSYDLKVSSPANYYGLAVDTVGLVAVILLIIGLVTAVVLVTFMRIVVTAPITRVIAHTNAISKHGNLTRRLNFNRSDEIGGLATAYDAMLEQVQQARQQIQEMSYVSGMADTAADILHNIRNTLNPITTSVWKGRETLKEFKTTRLTQAAEELVSPDTDNSRKAKLAAFVAATSKHIEDRSKTIETELATIQEFTNQIEDVLSQHDEVTRATRVSEPISPGEIVEYASKVILSSTKTPIRIVVSESLEGILPALAQRVLLRQVVENLAVNAVQSIDQHKPETPRISFAVRSLDKAIELSITDNGVGISPESLDTIFARGTSTKGNAGRGIGLHFCATSLNAMNGRIAASSAGLGQGATFTIQLPIAHRQEDAA